MCMILSTLICTVITQAAALLLHHIAFPRHSDQLSGGEGGELQGEGGVVVVVRLSIIVDPLIEWRLRTVLVVPQTTN